MQFRRVPGQILVFESILIFEQEVIHLPKTSLRAGCFGSFSRLFSVRMHRSQGKISKCKTQIVSQIPLNRLDDRISLPARGTFVIAIFKECHQGIDKPLDVVAVTEWDVEFVERDGAGIACFIVGPFFVAGLRVRIEYEL